MNSYEAGTSPGDGTGRRRPRRPVHTYSVIARDPTTGEFGAAVQSHWFAVGTICIWAESGTGAVATQALADPSYGKLGLDLMRAGKSAPDALRGLLAADEFRETRQVAMIDAMGLVTAHTGGKTIPAAGHHAGKEYSVQANMMLNDRVWPAMAEAFETATGDLAGRMLAALEAGQAAGGDLRGQQSAALVVVAGAPTGRPWADRIFDLRVDDHPEPLAELRRLIVLQRAYNHMNAGDKALERGDHPKALAEYATAAGLASENLEVVYWHGVALVNMQRLDDALPLFRSVFARERNWVELTPRLAAAGLLPNDPHLIARICKAGD
jgi:uncharacterized Ntn-hydrolase superfamily protein